MNQVSRCQTHRLVAVALVIEEDFLPSLPDVPEEVGAFDPNEFPGAQFYLHVRLGTSHCRKPHKPPPLRGLLVAG